MNSTNCNIVQELIAIAAELSYDNNIHLKDCAKCQAVLNEYNQLRQMFEMNFEVNIPDNFANAVMNRIDEESASSINDWFAQLQGSAAKLMSYSVPQWIFLSIGFLASISNFIRFVFFILTPAGN